MEVAKRVENNMNLEMSGNLYGEWDNIVDRGSFPSGWRVIATDCLYYRDMDNDSRVRIYRLPPKSIYMNNNHKSSHCMHDRDSIINMNTYHTFRCTQFARQYFANRPSDEVRIESHMLYHRFHRLAGPPAK